MEGSVARDLWLRLEPVHAAVYFAPEARGVYADAGLKGYWMGYFASRAAALGACPAEVVIATFYNFAERMVRRAIPDAWAFSTPDRVLEARLRVADIATRRVLGDVAAPAVAEAARLAEAAARAARPPGRPLFAAHAALPWPEEPHLRLWHAATLLREHRGDGHVAVLTATRVDGAEAHVLAAAAGRIDPSTQKQHRGWSDEEWDAAAGRLRARGLVDDRGDFSEAGSRFKQRLEDETDALALQPYEEIGSDACASLIALLDDLAETPGVPYPNAMALPPR